MSATRTFTQWAGGGADSAIIVGDPWRPTQGNYVRQGLDVLGYNSGTYPLGGLELPYTVIVGGTYEDVKGAIDLSLNGDSLGGLTLEIIIFSYTSNAATSVTARLRNITDSTTAAQGAANTSTSKTTGGEVVTATLASGVKTYRLQWTASNTTNPVYPPWGVLRCRKVPT